MTRISRGCRQRSMHEVRRILRKVNLDVHDVSPCSSITVASRRSAVKPVSPPYQPMGQLDEPIEYSQLLSLPGFRPWQVSWMGLGGRGPPRPGPLPCSPPGARALMGRRAPTGCSMTPARSGRGSGPMALYVGGDRAEDHHRVHLMDEAAGWSVRVRVIRGHCGESSADPRPRA